MYQVQVGDLAACGRMVLTQGGRAAARHVSPWRTPTPSPARAIPPLQASIVSQHTRKKQYLRRGHLPQPRPISPGMPPPSSCAQLESSLQTLAQGTVRVPGTRALAAHSSLPLAHHVNSVQHQHLPSLRQRHPTTARGFAAAAPCTLQTH